MPFQFNSFNPDSNRIGRQKSTENLLAKTHCRNDHEYTEENTKIDSRGNRVCKQCIKNQIARERIGPRVER